MNFSLQGNVSTFFFSHENRDDALTLKPTATLSSNILEAWSSLPPEVRSALVSSEMSASGRSTTLATGSDSSITSGSSNSGDKSDDQSEIVEEDADSGTVTVMKPLERAPKNVFAISKTNTKESTSVEKTSASTVTTKKTIVTRTKGWRNVFSLPISYDVNMIPCGTLLDPSNSQMLDATGNHPEGYNRRFAVIDNVVNKLYGDKIRQYFIQNGIELTTCVLNGGEDEKRPDVS